MIGTRFAFRAPDGWENRRGTQFQHRGCSTPACLASANWMIARNAYDRGAVRYACDECKAKKYGKLEERQLSREVVSA